MPKTLWLLPGYYQYLTLIFKLLISMALLHESLGKMKVEGGRRKRNDSRTIAKTNSQLTLSLEETVHHNSDYIFVTCGTQSDPEFRIGTGLSNRKCVIYSMGESLKKTATLTHCESRIVDIKFSPTSKNIFYTATNKGYITACDLRAKGKVVAQFKDCTEGGKLKSLSSFDISYDDKLLSGGTEQIGGDAFILFWDLRYSNSNKKNNLLGGYWESHMEEVTNLSFHPNKKDVLASGSTDGLINVFDLTKPKEDAALTYSLNTESSVDRIGWINDDKIWCTTYMYTLQLWDCNEATPYANFDRSQLAASQNEDSDDCYIVRFHVSNAREQSYFLAGSTNVKKENLKCMNVANDCISRSYNMVGNRQIVRDSWLHEKSGCLITVGEVGLLNIWKPTECESVTSEQDSEQKSVTKISTNRIRNRQNRSKPY